MPAGKPLLDAVVIGELKDRVRARGDWLERLEAARRWSSSFSAADIETTREISLQGTFLQRIFVDVLGYSDQGSGLATWSLTAHPQTEINARIPDGVLGIFRSGSEPRTHAVVELKDALTDLDAKQLQREDRLSPVEQAFLYLASYENASFAIVSNFKVLRLYARRYGMVRFHEFDLTRLDEPEEVAGLIALCGIDSLIPTQPARTPPLVEHLLDSPPRAQREITASFYESYSVIRDRLVGHVQESQPGLGAEAVHVVQKLLDRVLFIAYAEDVGLLPSTILSQTINHGLTSRSRSNTRAWDELRYLFQDIDRGRSDLSPAINRYNGGLFANDRVLDEQIAIPDELVAELKTIASFDFKTEVDVNILGHVFENSIADIETLRRSIGIDPHFIERDLPAVDQHRRDLGVYYTGRWVTGFIVDETLGRILQQRGSHVRRQLQILDPACGSGAFLSEALSYLSDHTRALAAEGMAVGELDLFSEIAAERPSDYLTQLFGIDLMYESVEIAKLSLWLKSADRSKPLGGVEGIIRGNSLVAPEDPDGYGSSPIASVLTDGGFDVVVGNPPWGSEIDYALDPALQLATGQFDSYELFVERALVTFLSEDGYFGFIVPDRILRPEGERLRRFLFDNYRVRAILKAGEGVFEGVFRASAIIIVQKALPEESDTYTGLVVTKADRAELEQSGAAHVATLIAQRGGAIPVSRVLQDPNYSIDLVPQADLDIKDKMLELRSPWIGENGLFAKYGRGDELGVDSFVIQCPSCFGWSINPRRRAQRRGGGYEPKVCPHCGNEFAVEDAIERLDVTDASPDPTSWENIAELYTGEQVNRYWLDEPSTIRLGIPGVQYKEDELFRGPKLLIRQTSVGIYASLDASDRRCLQSVYVYKTADESPVRPEYYLAQLNSRAMLFFYFIDTNQIEWQSYPKLTHRSLQRFPIHRPDLTDAMEKERHDAIVELVGERLQLAAATRGIISRSAIEVDYAIEGHVMDIFRLTASERTRINTRLRSEQNIRIIREMYPPAGSLT